MTIYQPDQNINPWIYQGREFTDNDIEDYKAFVYQITGSDGKYYIGRKNFFAPKTYQKNGKRRKKMVISDYKSYYGSSVQLLNDIKELGVDSFTREILVLCKSKGESNYIEAKIQFERGVLLDENAYNSIINCRVHASHVKTLKGNG